MAYLINALLVGALVAVFLNAGKWFGPRPRHAGDADEPYETGMLPIAPSQGRMAVLYYRFAVLFVVFDVDLALFLPWAVQGPALDLQKMVSVTVFTGLLVFMLAYFWRRGVLEC